MLTVFRRVAAIYVALAIPTLPALAIPQCTLHSVVVSGGSERANINSFENMCGAAVPSAKREFCQCTTRAIATGLSSPLHRELFRFAVLVDAYPWYDNDARSLLKCMSDTERAEYNAERARFESSQAWKACTAGMK